MGWLVGLPLGLLRLLFGFVMLALRLAVPIAIIAVAVYLLRRGRSGSSRQGQPRQEKPKEPHFDGPVYTVDYEEVPPDGEDKGKP